MTGAELQLLPLIVILFAVHLLVPGPNMLFLATAASRGGAREAAAFALGTSAGTGLWAAGAALGALHLLDRADGLAEVLAVGFGGVLIAFGLRSIREAWTGIAVVEPGALPSGTLARVFMRGLVVTLANVSEFVFWGAVMGFLARVETGVGFGVALAFGTAAAALAFDLAFATIASRGQIGALLRRWRRGLEALTGMALAGAGGVLIGTLPVFAG